MLDQQTYKDDHLIKNDLCLKVIRVLIQLAVVCVCTQSLVDFKCNTSVNDCLSHCSMCYYDGHCSMWTLPVAITVYIELDTEVYSDFSILWQAFFSVSIFHSQDYQTNITASCIIVVTVGHNTLDFFNKRSSFVIILNNAVYYYCYLVVFGE